VVIPTAPVITQTPVVSKVISVKPIEPKVILPAPVERISTPAEPAPAVITPEPKKITISADLLFAFDSAELSSEGRNALTKIAGDIEAAGTDDVVTVLGHTDRLGSTKYNQVLSERRAAAVSDFLQEKLQSKIEAKGLGKSQPTEVTAGCSGQRAALISCLQPDRRVEIIVGQK
jgi:OOP family OmpA-OmpF porin